MTLHEREHEYAHSTAECVPTHSNDVGVSSRARLRVRHQLMVLLKPNVRPSNRLTDRPDANDTRVTLASPDAE